MPYDHNSDFDWTAYQPPTEPSPSGIFPLNDFGQKLLAKILPFESESAFGWLRRLESHVPQIGYGPPLGKEFRERLQMGFEGRLPAMLLELWRYAPGLELRQYPILFDPVRLASENRYYADIVPEIMTSRVFIAGADGFSAAVALGGEDPDLRAHEWSHEEGFTGRTAPTLMHYLAERAAWYATTFQPFCYQHGYVGIS
ncbi:MAG TPA: hypothetical protein VK956_09325 [Verrucomicrobium sp.]|nr:hypothetical protein [Verrucomicrobium sp.]